MNLLIKYFYAVREGLNDVIFEDIEYSLKNRINS